MCLLFSVVCILDIFVALSFLEFRTLVHIVVHHLRWRSMRDYRGHCGVDVVPWIWIATDSKRREKKKKKRERVTWSNCHVLHTGLHWLSASHLIPFSNNCNTTMFGPSDRPTKFRETFLAYFAGILVRICLSFAAITNVLVVCMWLVGMDWRRSLFEEHQWHIWSRVWSFCAWHGFHSRLNYVNIYKFKLFWQLSNA